VRCSSASAAPPGRSRAARAAPTPGARPRRACTAWPGARRTRRCCCPPARTAARCSGTPPTSAATRSASCGRRAAGRLMCCGRPRTRACLRCPPSAAAARAARRAPRAGAACTGTAARLACAVAARQPRPARARRARAGAQLYSHLRRLPRFAAGRLLLHGAAGRRRAPCATGGRGGGAAREGARAAQVSLYSLASFSAAGTSQAFDANFSESSVATGDARRAPAHPPGPASASGARRRPPLTAGASLGLPGLTARPARRRRRAAAAARARVAAAARGGHIRLRREARVSEQRAAGRAGRRGVRQPRSHHRPGAARRSDAPG